MALRWLGMFALVAAQVAGLWIVLATGLAATAALWLVNAYQRKRRRSTSFNKGARNKHCICWAGRFTGCAGRSAAGQPVEEAPAGTIHLFDDPKNSIPLEPEAGTGTSPAVGRDDSILQQAPGTSGAALLSAVCELKDQLQSVMESQQQVLLQLHAQQQPHGAVHEHLECA